MHQAVHRSHSNYFRVLDVEMLARGGKQVANHMKSAPCEQWLVSVHSPLPRGKDGLGKPPWR